VLGPLLRRGFPSPRALARRKARHNLVGRYLPDLVFGANDGIITTLAVVSGVVGASLSTRVILILGFANLLADGVSMGASNVLSRRSAADHEAMPSLRVASYHGLATFVGFVVAGVVPLLAYLVPGLGGDRFVVAGVLALATLFAVGASRSLFIRRPWHLAGLEMLLIGAAAGALAYLIGMAGAWLTA
jgi:VIT1/CCC1 family predicted Fe2+/Mn2+ transporter